MLFVSSQRPTSAAAAAAAAAAQSLPVLTARLSVVDDYGQLPGGVSNARYVLAENGDEYIIKGPTLCPAMPHVAANELIAAYLADQLGLPLLDYRVLEFNGDIYFGSSWMAKPTFYPAVTADLLSRCENKDRVYDLITFDWLINNVDRHEQNLIVRRVGRSGLAERNLLVLNDHSHSIVVPGYNIDELHKHQDEIPPVRIDFVRDSVTDIVELRRSVEIIEGMRDATIEATVASIPEPFLSDGYRSAVAAYLIHRKNNLRRFFEAERSVFPKLGKGTL